MSIDEDNFVHSDEEIDEKKHQKLLDNVLSLNKAQQLKKPTRTEPALEISEFDLVKSLAGSKGSVYIDDLTKVLVKKKKHVDIKKKVDKAQTITKTLPKPLEKPIANRIQRAVAYEKARLELDRWEPIITANRVSTNLVFPLPDSKKDKNEDLTKRWQLKTIFDIEKEKIYPPKVEEIHVDVDKEKFKMSMKEIVEHRKEEAKLRAHQSYKEAKARRQNKIKSKKYHRIQRKEKIKQQLKEFEQLQKTDPEEALKKLEEIERIRAHERFSLRHKSTGKWAKSKQIRAKYDKESRQELAQQLTLSKELTQKISKDSDSEDEPIQQESDVVLNSTEKENPWLNGFKVDKELSGFVDNYKKYWLEKVEKDGRNVQKITDSVDKFEELDKDGDEVEEAHINLNDIREDEEITNQKQKELNESQTKKLKKKKSKSKAKVLEMKGTSEWEIEEMKNENIDVVFDKLEKSMKNKLEQKLKKALGESKPKSPKKKRENGDRKKKGSLLDLPLEKKRPRIDEELAENIDEETESSDNALNELKNILQKEAPIEKKKTSGETNIDPNKFMKLKEIQLESELPDISTNFENDDEEEDNPSQQDLIAEAFQDDELIEEFSKEKSDVIEKNKPKDINLTLPGWGSWGGTGIVPSKRRQKRFILKTPKKLPRRDDNKGFLIINEDAANKVKEHMVDELPFPFARVKDFEASIRAPIGRTFVPETAFRRLTKPSVRTKIGSIIEPMDKEVLLKKS